MDYRAKNVLLMAFFAAQLWVVRYHDNWSVLLAYLGGTLLVVALSVLVREVFGRPALVLPPGARVGSTVIGAPPPRYPSVSLIPAHVGEARAFGFSADGRLLAVGGGNAVVLWDVNDPANPLRTATLTWPTGVIVVSAAFNPHAPLLATGTTDQNATLWRVDDPSAPTRIAILRLPRHRRCDTGGAMDFSPDGRLLATADRAADLWDVTDPQRPVRTASVPLLRRWQADACRAAAFSGDGRLLATAGRAAVTLWDVADPAHPRRVTTLRPQGRGAPGHAIVTMSAVDFSPDGRLLATAGVTRIESVNEWAAYSSSSSAVALWDIADPAHPTLIVTLAERDSSQAERGQRGSDTTVIGHSRTVRAVQFSPDAPLLATAGDDGVLLWDITDPAAPHPTAQFTQAKPVPAVAFSPDGRLLAIGSQDHTAALWTTSPPSG